VTAMAFYEIPQRDNTVAKVQLAALLRSMPASLSYGELRDPQMKLDETNETSIRQLQDFSFAPAR